MWPYSKHVIFLCQLSHSGNLYFRKSALIPCALYACSCGHVVCIINEAVDIIIKDRLLRSPFTKSYGLVLVLNLCGTMKCCDGMQAKRVMIIS